MSPADVRAAMVGWLRGNPSVVRECAGRVYADAAPRDAAMPLVSVQRTGHTRVRTASGLAGLSSSGFRVVAWSADPEGRDRLADAVRDCIESKAAGDGSEVESVWIASDTDGFEVVDDAGPGGWWTCAFEVEVQHQRGG